MYKEVIELNVESDDKGKRLDSFICENIEDLTRSYIQNLIEAGEIEINVGGKIKAGMKLKGNETIRVGIPEDEVLEVEAENIPIDIVYEDNDIVVVNKGADMVVHPAPGNYSGTLVNAIMYHIKNLSSINGVIRPGIVHRLDKDTSGLIIIAKNNQSHLLFSDMFKDKSINKYYLAIVKGVVKEDSGRIENHIGRNPVDRKKMDVVSKNGKNAISNYYVLDRCATHSLLMVGIETGRTHQIRVHMKHIGHPIEGDQVYSKNNKYADRQMLHAYRLEFVHPLSGEKFSIKSKLPDDFEKLMLRLKLEFSSEKADEIVREK